jgi:hypothetical protein
MRRSVEEAIAGLDVETAARITESMGYHLQVVTQDFGPELTPVRGGNWVNVWVTQGKVAGFMEGDPFDNLGPSDFTGPTVGDAHPLSAAAVTGPTVGDAHPLSAAAVAE